MSDDRVIGYLRTRARVEAEPELVARIMAAVDAAPPARSPFAAFPPAVAIAGAVAIVTALALILGQGPNVGPEPTQSVEARPSPASVEELRGALESAVAGLREAPGVDGIATSSILDELSGATWFSWRPSGDQVVVERVDLNVSEGAWWMDPRGEPSSRGENVMTTIRILVGNDYYLATADRWNVTDASEAPPVLALMTGLLDDRVEPFLATLGADAGGEASVHRLSDGGEVWRLSAPYRDGRATSEWRIAADGSLATWSSDLSDVTPTLEDAPFVTSLRVAFTPLPDPGPIEAPDPDSPPDPAALGLPPDFPLGAAAQDHR